VSLDAKGMFRINVDRDKGNLVAIHYDSSKPTAPLNVIEGRTADAINAKIIALGLVSKLDHAAYLGRELAKAEIALQTGKAYVQDTTLFGK
jgi:dihydropteroate synthase